MEFYGVGGILALVIFKKILRFFLYFDELC